MINLYALIAMTAFAASVGSMPLLKRLAQMLRIVAHPDARHPEPVAAIGGPAIIGAFVLALGLTHQLSDPLVYGALLLCAIGVLDDAIELRPGQKLLGEIAVIAPIVAMGAHFNLFPWPWLDWAITVFWLLSTTNAFNLIDGLDGLSAGTAIIVCAAIGVTAVMQGQPLLAIEAIALGGATLGFILYNFQPASVFMGDGGSLPIGFLLGSLALQGRMVATNGWLSAYTFPLLVMLLPLLDTAIVTTSRIATGQPVSRRGLDHSHHRLLALGLSERRTVMLCWAASAVAGVLAICEATLSFSTALAMLPLVAVAVAVVGIFMVDLTFDTMAPGTAYPALRGVGRVAVKLVYKWRVADAALDLLVIMAAFMGAFLLRLDFSIPAPWLPGILGSLPYVCVVSWLALLTAGVYRGIWKFAGLSELARFGYAAALAGLAVIMVSGVFRLATSGSIVVMFALLLFNLLVATRMSFHLLHRGVKSLANPSRRVLIIGAGNTGAAAVELLFSTHNSGVMAVGFADDDSFKLGKWVHGCPVLGSINELEGIRRTTFFNEILMASPSLPPIRRNSVIEFAQRHGISLEDFSMPFGAPAAPTSSSVAGAAAPMVLEPSLQRTATS